MGVNFPDAPNVGDAYTSGGYQWMWDGSAWVSVGQTSSFLPLTGGQMTGPLLLNADPAVALGAATKRYTDAAQAAAEAYTDAAPYLPLSGGTLTGPLALAQDPVGVLDATTKQYTDAGDNALIGAGARYGWRNKIMNPGFLISQRGNLSGLATGTWPRGPDGWFGYAVGGNWTLGLGGGAYPGSRNSVVTAGASGVALTSGAYLQRIESYDIAPICNTTCTFQALCVSSGAANAPTLSASYAGAQDNFTSPVTFLPSTNLQPMTNGVWTLLALTFNIPSAAAVGAQFQLSFTNIPAGGYFAMTDVDLRATPGWPIGLCANPPPAEIRPAGIEFPWCLRYYEVGSNHMNSFGGTGTSGSASYQSIQFRQPKRATPTMTYQIAGANCYPSQAPTAWTANALMCGVYMTCNAAAVTPYYYFNFQASAEL